MKFILEIEMGNDAMLTHTDVSSALRFVQAKLSEGRNEGRVMDINGNSVGKWEFTEEKKKTYEVTIKRGSHLVPLGEAKRDGNRVLVKLFCLPVDGCFTLEEKE